MLTPLSYKKKNTKKSPQKHPKKREAIVAIRELSR